jgi:uncharacterized membrane protein
VTRTLLGLGLLIAACAEPVVELDDYPCMEDPALTYETFGRAFIAEHCDRCHAAGPGLRHGAPESYRFETLDGVRRHRVRIFARSATTNTSMPPGPMDPAPEARERLATWLACGAR